MRSILFNTVMYGSALVLSVWSYLLTYVSPAKICGVARFWAAVTLGALRYFCGVTLKVEGAENLPPGGALIAAQHQSALDIMVWLRQLPRPAYVLKRELLSIPLFGSSLLPAGMIAVDRGRNAGNLRKMVEECRAALAAGRQIVIFPEGTRVAPGARATLRSGIAVLAQALDIPVIPAATNSGSHWGRKAFFKTPGIVKVKIYPALSSKLQREEMLARLTTCFYENGVN